jgi:hypothetical protein
MTRKTMIDATIALVVSFGRFKPSNSDWIQNVTHSYKFVKMLSKKSIATPNRLSMRDERIAALLNS